LNHQHIERYVCEGIGSVINVDPQPIEPGCKKPDGKDRGGKQAKYTMTDEADRVGVSFQRSCEHKAAHYKECDDRSIAVIDRHVGTER
jgi:hypothetical protein